MNRFVIMVDAGYLLRQAVEILSHRFSRVRSELHITDPAGLVAAIVRKSRSTLDLAGRELLRVYWYDGVLPNGPTQQQRALGHVDDVQLRAGTVNGKGQQKGVDSLIVTDLIELASHHAITDAVLVTGDSDLAIGIELVQRRGVRVAVVGVEDVSVGVAHHQSFEIISRADRVAVLGQEDLASSCRYVPEQPKLSQMQPLPKAGSLGPAQTAPELAPVEVPDISAAVKAFIAQRGESLVGVIEPTSRHIERTVDAALLAYLTTALQTARLSDAEKAAARRIFRAELQGSGGNA